MKAAKLREVFGLTTVLIVFFLHSPAFADERVQQGASGGWNRQLGQPIAFTDACAPGDWTTIAAVGDILLHSPLQRQATRDSRRFTSLWQDIVPLFNSVDVAYANLEGPAAYGVDRNGRDVRDPGLTFDEHVYTSYPQFNYPPALIEDLVSSGIDVVSTANNHSLDRQGVGVDRTIEALENNGLPYTGTRHAQRTSHEWHTVTSANGFNIAWLACTYSTNGIPDRRNQVLNCYRQTEQILGMIRELRADRRIDAVIVTPHWGEEYQHNPDRAQSTLAYKMLESGALAVLGTHPHVLQPWEKYVTRDGRETFILYSSGNFVSNQSQLPRRTSILLYLALGRDNRGEAFVRGIEYVPLWMIRSSNGHREVRPITRASGREVPREAWSLWERMFNPQHQVVDLHAPPFARLCL